MRGDGFFVCYYHDSGGKDGPVIIMQMNTSFWEVLVWFILPLSGLPIFWLLIFICVCWFCCPGNYMPPGLRKPADNFEVEEDGGRRVGGRWDGRKEGRRVG